MDSSGGNWRNNNNNNPNDDLNRHRLAFSKGDPHSPNCNDETTTCASSTMSQKTTSAAAVLGMSSSSSTTSTLPPNPVRQRALQQQRRRGGAATAATLQQQEQRLVQHQERTQPLLLATSASTVALIISVIPTSLLLGLSMVLCLWTVLLHNLFLRGRLQVETRVAHGRGFGSYLPQRLYDLLTTRSFHEFMSDGAFLQENYHFLLYFIPGITVEQLDGYVNALVPRHRRTLNRPGMGHLLGPNFMRYIVGDEGLSRRDRAALLRQQEANDNNNNNATSSDHNPPGRRNDSNMIPRRLVLETHHEEVNDNATTPPSPPYVRYLGVEEASPVHRPPWTPDPRLSRAIVVEQDDAASVLSDDDDMKKTEDDDDEDDDDGDEDLTINENVVWEAFFGGIRAYRNMALSSVGRSTAQTMNTIAMRIFMIGATTLGLGALGYWGAAGGSERLRVSLPRVDLSWMYRSLPRMERGAMALLPDNILLPPPFLLASTLSSAGTIGLLSLLGWTGKNDDDDDPSKRSSDNGKDMKKKPSKKRR